MVFLQFVMFIPLNYFGRCSYSAAVQAAMAFGLDMDALPRVMGGSRGATSHDAVPLLYQAAARRASTGKAAPSGRRCLQARSRRPSMSGSP